MKYYLRLNAAAWLVATLASLLPCSLRSQSVPVITTTVPANFTTGVAPATPAVFTFSAAMNTSVTSVQFLDAANPGVSLPATVSWNAAKTQMTCSPQPAWPGNSVVTWVVTGLDQLNHPLGGNTSGMFMTGSGGPYIVSTSPENGASDVPRNTSVVFTFSAAMNTAGTTALFHPATDPLNSLPVQTQWSADKTQLTCSPTPVFPVGQMIQWIVSGEDLLGNSLEPASGLFSTVAGVVTLVSVIPTNGAVNVPTNAQVVFVFSAAMNTNGTAAQFHSVTDPLHPWPMAQLWTVDQTQLTCVPTTAFPPGQIVAWSVNGEDAQGNSLSSSNGLFTVLTNSSPTVPVSLGLLSRGTIAEQVDAELLATSGHEFIALSAPAARNSVAVVTPGAVATNVLHETGDGVAWEFTESVDDPAAFLSLYPAGEYRFRVRTDTTKSEAVVSLAEGALPAAPMVANWPKLHATLGQAWTLQWNYGATGATVDYVRLKIEKDGRVIYSSPLPESAGALDGASRNLTLPADTFTNVGRAVVTLCAFHFTSLDDRSLPGTRVRTATHSTTTFNLRVVNGSGPSPGLLTSNLTGIPIGEPFLSPLRSTNGVRPLYFELIDGTLPPGLVLQNDGWLTGQATALGSYDVRLRLTDLVGHVATQTMHLATAELPLDTAPARLERIARENGTSLVFDLVGAAGGERVVEQSLDLSNWTTLLTTNPATDRVTIWLPIADQAAFFRARSSGLSFLTPRPRTVVPHLNPQKTVSATLDEWGGTLSFTNSGGYVFRLQVPLGALANPETISMTEISQIDGLPLSGGLRAAVDLRPEGLIFDRPARLDITSPQAVDPRTILGFGARSDGSQFALNSAFTTNNTVSLYLWHFSPAGMGEGTSADSAAQAQNGTDDPMTSLAQQIAATVQACKANPNCGQIGDELIPTYIAMADQVIIPKLKQAVDDDSVIDDALFQWIQWLTELALFGYHEGDVFGGGTSAKTPELQKRVCRAGNLAARALRNAIDKSCARCLQHEIWQIYRMWDLVRKGELLGLGYGHDAFWNCVRQCLVFELEVESEIVASDGGLIYSAHTKGKAKLRPQTLADDDPNTADLIRSKLIFTGSGIWNIVELQHSEPGDCAILEASASGKLQFPWVQIQLYKKRQTWVPGKGPITTYVLQPDMMVKMRSGLPPMPKENRTMYCPKAPPAKVPNLFEQTFNAFHNDEAQAPSGIEAEILGGPVFSITGFVRGGPEGIILSKPYFRTAGEATENTLIQLRHSPGH